SASLGRRLWAGRGGRGVAEVVDYSGKDLVERLPRAVADQAVDLVDAGHAPRHILEPLAVRLLIGDVDGLRRRPGDRPDATGQRPDRDLLARAYVEGLADRAGVVHQADQRRDHVADVGEATRLGPVAVDRDRTAGEGLLDERRHNHAVLPGLPRPHGVEQ